MDGAKEIGKCEIIETQYTEVKDILEKIELVEGYKRDFQTFINSIQVLNSQVLPNEWKKS